MAHRQQQRLIEGLVGDGGSRMAGKSILEFGSYDINGSVRGFFGAASRYVGVDWRAGPGVDHVCLFHQIPWEYEFDVLISCNTFEHDPYWPKSIESGIQALRHGGELILTAASHGFQPHELETAPPTESGMGNYYMPIDGDELHMHLRACGIVGTLLRFPDPSEVAFLGYRA